MTPIKDISNGIRKIIKGGLKYRFYLQSKYICRVFLLQKRTPPDLHRVVIDQRQGHLSIVHAEWWTQVLLFLDGTIVSNEKNTMPQQNRKGPGLTICHTRALYFFLQFNPIRACLLWVKHPNDCFECSISGSTPYMEGTLAMVRRNDAQLLPGSGRCVNRSCQYCIPQPPSLSHFFGYCGYENKR